MSSLLVMKKFLAGLAGSGVLSLSGCGAIFSVFPPCLGDVEPREGVYSISYSDGTDEDMIVEDRGVNSVFSNRFYAHFVSYNDNQFYGGKGCQGYLGPTCNDCPSDGWHVRGCFDSETTVQGHYEKTVYCGDTQFLSFSGEFVGPLEE